MNKKKKIKIMETIFMICALITILAFLCSLVIGILLFLGFVSFYTVLPYLFASLITGLGIGTVTIVLQAEITIQS